MRRDARAHKKRTLVYCPTSVSRRDRPRDLESSCGRTAALRACPQDNHCAQQRKCHMLLPCIRCRRPIIPVTTASAYHGPIEDDRQIQAQHARSRHLTDRLRPTRRPRSARSLHCFLHDRPTTTDFPEPELCRAAASLYKHHFTFAEIFLAPTQFASPLRRGRMLP